LTLYYPKLDKKQTIKIWKMNLRRVASSNEDRINAGRPSIEYDEKKILQWAKGKWEERDWNGRQIRNAFQTAMALAEFKAKKSVEGEQSSSTSKPAILEISHFKTIAKASTQFNNYLRQVHGIEENLAAYKDRSRANPEAKISASIYTEDYDSDSDVDSSESEDSTGESNASTDDESDESDASEKKKTKKKSKKEEKKKDKTAKGSKDKSKSKKKD
jgi:hypothetical protein